MTGTTIHPELNQRRLSHVLDIFRHRPRRDEQGQVLLIVAGGLVVFLLFAGLVIDTGIGFREQRTSQNISDLSSMAGTRVIANSYLDPTVPVDGADVYAAVADSATNNAYTDPCAWEGTYVKPVSVGVTTDLGPVVNGGAIPTGAQGVRVSTDRHPSTFFMKVVGIATLDVGASATALTSQVLEPPPAGILLPIGILNADYQVGTNYTLTEKGHGATWAG